MAFDSVNLQGEGFEALVKEGDDVQAGQPLLKVDLESVKDKVPSIITPVIFTNLSEGEKVVLSSSKTVESGDADVVKIA